MPIKVSVSPESGSPATYGCEIHTPLRTSTVRTDLDLEPVSIAYIPGHGRVFSKVLKLFNISQHLSRWRRVESLARVGKKG